MTPTAAAAYFQAAASIATSGAEHFRLAIGDPAFSGIQTITAKPRFLVARLHDRETLGNKETNGSPAGNSRVDFPFFLFRQLIAQLQPFFQTVHDQLRLQLNRI